MPDSDVAALTEHDDAPSRRPFPKRLTSAVRRRARWAWLRLNGGVQNAPAEAAIQWLHRHGADGLRPTPESPDACPGLTGATVTTAVCYGQHELAAGWSEWLAALQRPEGSLPEIPGGRASTVNTAHALSGWLSLCDASPELLAPARRATEFLMRCLPEKPPGDVAPVCLAPLALAARRFCRADWQRAAMCAARAYCRRHALRGAAVDVNQVVQIDALVELGFVELAREAAHMASCLQRRDGSVPAGVVESWVCSRAVAQSAVTWYKLGEREQADRAMAWLVRRQSPCGGLLGSFGRGAAYYPRRQSAWAVKYFLDAAWLQVGAALASEPHHRPRNIAAGDGRVEAVRRWAAELPDGVRIVDVGCGSGRYLKHLAAAVEGDELTGIDRLPLRADRPLPRLEFRRGSMLNLPADDGAFDAALAIESLEHALLPGRAVDELCRVVRPGGRILVIDKHRDWQALSEHQPWERWFTPDEVSAWLARHCSEVTVQPIAHEGHRKPTGLFLCWTAVRRTSAAAIPIPYRRQAA